MSEPKQLPDEIEALLTPLYAADTDISEWLQLARRQYDEMSHNAALCPTKMGVEQSEQRQTNLRKAIVSLRALIAQQAAEIQKPKLNLTVLDNFRSDDLKALQFFRSAGWDGDSDLWASLVKQRDDARAEVERLRAQSNHSGFPNS